MLQPIKYLIFGVLFVVLIYYSGVISIKQSNTVRTVENIDISLESAQLGTLRANKKQSVIDKEEVLSELITEVSKDAKNHDGDMNIQYVFLDKNGNKTSQEAQIDSIQFIVKLMNEDGESVAETVQRYSLKDGG